MGETIIKVEHISKEYRLGTIGGGTLKGDLQSVWARLRGKEDPNGKIGTAAHSGTTASLRWMTFPLKSGRAKPSALSGTTAPGSPRFSSCFPRHRADQRNDLL